MAPSAHRRTGQPLAELALEARALSAAELARDFGPAFLLRQGGATHASGMVLQTMTAHSAGRTEAQAGRGLLDYRVYVVRRAGTTRFGGDYIGLGRADHNDLVIEDPSVSKFHALIVQEGPSFSLSDAGSRNGTFINDQRAPNYREGRPAPLRDGDSVRLGDVRLTFMLSEGVWRLLQRAGT